MPRGVRRGLTKADYRSISSQMSTSEANETLVPGNLVRWMAAPGTGVGVVTTTAANGKQAPRASRQRRGPIFAWPNDVARARVFDPATSHLGRRRRGRRRLGRERVDGRTFYAVNLPGGRRRPSSRTACDAPSSPTRSSYASGQLDSARSVNLRLAATRLLFAHQYRRAVVTLELARRDQAPPGRRAPPRRDVVPSPLSPRRRGRARQDDRGGADPQGAQGARHGGARPGPRAVRDRLASGSSS